jgi:hypothetical protein
MECIRIEACCPKPPPPKAPKTNMDDITPEELEDQFVNSGEAGSGARARPNAMLTLAPAGVIEDIAIIVAVSIEAFPQAPWAP